MGNITIGIIVFAVALIVSLAVYPQVLKFAKSHNIVDNPNARKLQRVPIPVMGGVVVYAGILAGGLTLSLFMKSDIVAFGLIGMAVMMIIGVWDDIKDISAKLRFLIEFSLVGVFIAISDTYVDNLHGLWGVYELAPWVGILISLVCGVGIINAVNLIDGVDGYSSGYGMLACTCFGLVFWLVWSPPMVYLTLVAFAALLPFFLHNVFGAQSKMFIGDGGTLMLGTLVAVLSFFSVSSKQKCEVLVDQNVGLIAFTLSVLCIPVFDTLRVMTLRILRGRSPFSPDKTHLHHLFIDMGFSHLGAALFILFINLLVVLIWMLSWKLGASIDLQTYVVIALGVMVTFGFYKLMRVQQTGGPVDEDGYPQGTALWHKMCKLGSMTHRENKRIWIVLRNLMDTPLLGGK